MGQPVYAITGVMNASCTQRLSSTAGTQVTSKTSCAMTANTTGAASTAPMITRRVKSATAARRRWRLGKCRLAARRRDRRRRGPRSLLAVASDDERAVHHVHPAGEAVLASVEGCELHRRRGESWERAVDTEVCEHHPRCAIAGLLTIEQQ